MRLKRDDTASAVQLTVLSMRRPTIGDRSLAVAAPRAWNKLPETLQKLSPLPRFKQLLKTFQLFFPRNDNLLL